ncbi:MAG: NAD(P)/FAD-dependent oxidoreductase [Alphaproteobacteria bacterium]
MEVIVIGAGITGVSAAEWLRRDGHKVTLIDRVRPGDPAQTSYGNAGILARAGVVPVSVPGLIWKAPGMLLDPNSPLYMRLGYMPRLMPWLLRFLWNGRRSKVEQIARGLAALTWDSVDQHLALARGTPAERFIKRGYYTAIYRDRAAFEGDAFGFGLRRANGFEWEEWDRAALADYDPGLSEAYTFGAALKDHGFITSPAGYVAALAGHFEREGGAFLQGEVADISQIGGGRGAVTLIGGARHEADRVVLAAGVWSSKLAGKLGHKAAMESERGYHLTLTGVSHMPPAPYMVSDAKLAVTPMESGLRFAGTADFGGLDGPEQTAPLENIRRRVRQIYPKLEWDGEETWMGQRPSTVDSLPLLGPSPKAPCIHFAFGGQHVGLTMGPRVGRMTADMIAERKQNIDIAAYSVDRFDQH